MAGKLTDDFLKDLEELSDEEQAPEEISKPAEAGAQIEENKIPEISKLKVSRDYQTHLAAIEKDLGKIQEMDRYLTLEKTDPIYTLVRKSNEYLMEIENEIAILHKEIRDIYQSKFSELETIVYDPIQYTK